MSALERGLTIAAISGVALGGARVVNAEQAAQHELNTRGSYTEVLRTPPTSMAVESLLKRNMELSPASQEAGPRVNGLFLTDIRNGNVIGNVDSSTYENSNYHDSLELMRSVYKQLLISKGYTVEQTDIFMPANLRGGDHAVPTLTPDGDGKKAPSAFFTVDGVDSDGNPVSEGIVFFPSGTTGGWDVYTSETAELELALGGFNGRTIIEVPNPRDGTLLAFQYQTSDAPSRLVGVGTPGADKRIVWRVEQTPEMVASSLNLPDGIYNLDTNVAFGPNKMLKDTSGKVIAVSSREGDNWQTVENLVSSLNLETNAEGGLKLQYFFWNDQGNIFIREERDETHKRGVVAILDEKDGTWHNLRDAFKQMMLSHSNYGGATENSQGQHFIQFNAVNYGLRTDLTIPIPGTDNGVGNMFSRAMWVGTPTPHDYIPESFYMETGLVVLGAEFHGTQVYMDWFGKVTELMNRQGIYIVGRIPLDQRDIDRLPLNTSDEVKNNTTELFLQYTQNQDLLNQLKQGVIPNIPLVWTLEYSILDPDPHAHIIFE